MKFPHSFGAWLKRSICQFSNMTDFNVEILPALQDNYMYLVCKSYSIFFLKKSEFLRFLHEMVVPEPAQLAALK